MGICCGFVSQYVRIIVEAVTSIGTPIARRYLRWSELA